MPSTVPSMAPATVPEYVTSSAQLRPRLTPDSTISGVSFMRWRTPMMTQSVGVPFTAKCRSPTSRKRSGSLSESECDTPDWSVSGATIQMSSDSRARDRLAGVEPRRVDAVVIGDEDTHYTRSIVVSPPM